MKSVLQSFKVRLVLIALRILFAATLMPARLDAQAPTAVDGIFRKTDYIYFEGAFTNPNNPDRSLLRIAFQPGDGSKKIVVRPGFDSQNIMRAKMPKLLQPGVHTVSVLDKKQQPILSTVIRLVDDKEVAPELVVFESAPGESLYVNDIPLGIKQGADLKATLRGKELAIAPEKEGRLWIAIPSDAKLGRRAKLDIFRTQLMGRVYVRRMSVTIVSPTIPAITFSSPSHVGETAVITMDIPAVPGIPDLKPGSMKVHIADGETRPRRVEFFSGDTLHGTISFEPRTGVTSIRDPNGGGFNIRPIPAEDREILEMILPDGSVNEVGEGKISEVDPQLASHLRPSSPVNPLPDISNSKLRVYVSGCDSKAARDESGMKVVAEVKPYRQDSPDMDFALVQVELHPVEGRPGYYEGDFPFLSWQDEDYLGTAFLKWGASEITKGLENTTDFACTYGNLGKLGHSMYKFADSAKAMKFWQNTYSNLLQRDFFHKASAKFLREQSLVATGAAEGALKDVSKNFFGALMDRPQGDINSAIDISASYLEKSDFALRLDAECALGNNTSACWKHGLIKASRGLGKIGTGLAFRDPLAVACAGLQFKYDQSDGESGVFGSIRHALRPDRRYADRFTVTPIVYKDGERLADSGYNRELRKYSYPLNTREVGGVAPWILEQDFRIGSVTNACPMVSLKDEYSYSGFNIGVLNSTKAWPEVGSDGEWTRFAFDRRGFDVYFHDFIGRIPVILAASNLPAGRSSTAFDVYNQISGQRKSFPQEVTTDRYYKRCELSRSSRLVLPEVSCDETDGLTFEFSVPSSSRANLPLAFHQVPENQLRGRNPFEEIPVGAGPSDSTRTVLLVGKLPPRIDKFSFCVDLYETVETLPVTLTVKKNGGAIYSSQFTFTPGVWNYCPYSSSDRPGGWRMDFNLGSFQDPYRQLSGYTPDDEKNLAAAAYGACKPGQSRSTIDERISTYLRTKDFVNLSAEKIDGVLCPSVKTALKQIGNNLDTGVFTTAFMRELYERAGKVK